MTARNPIIPIVAGNAAARSAQLAIRRIALVAILAVALGFFMQSLIVLARLLAVGAYPGASVFSELASVVTWSVLVCTGVAVGVSLGKARAALSGAIGLIFAPLSLAAAKGAQKVVAAAIDVSSVPSALSFELLGVVRGLEYGVLAFVLVLLSERKVARFLPYLGIGLSVGLVFGGFLSVMTLLSVDMALAEGRLAIVATTVITEIGFPIGCALLIYVSQTITNGFVQLQKGALPARA